MFVALIILIIVGSVFLGVYTAKELLEFKETLQARWLEKFEGTFFAYFLAVINHVSNRFENLFHAIKKLTQIFPNIGKKLHEILVSMGTINLYKINEKINEKFHKDIALLINEAIINPQHVIQSKNLILRFARQAIEELDFSTRNVDDMLSISFFSGYFLPSFGTIFSILAGIPYIAPFLLLVTLIIISKISKKIITQAPFI